MRVPSILVLVAGLLVAAPAPAAVTADFQPSTLTVDPGATFDLDLVVQAGSSFNAFDAIVGHDPGALTLVPLSPLSLQEGALMTAACGTRFHRFRHGADRDTATVVLLCDGVSVTGPGTIYRLRFQASATPQVTIVSLAPGLRFFDGGLSVPAGTPGDATITIGNLVDVAPGTVPHAWSLAAEPTPFSAWTQFAIGTRDGGRQSLVVYDARGRIVRRLFEGAADAGRRTIVWDGRTDAGGAAPPGLYFGRLRGAGVDLVTRVIRVAVR